MTAVSYAMTVGIMPRDKAIPRVFLPDDETVKPYKQTAIRGEGWIFAPYDQ